MITKETQPPTEEYKKLNLNLNEPMKQSEQLGKFEPEIPSRMLKE